jgi:cation diffusion facilitator family transporter
MSEKGWLYTGRTCTKVGLGTNILLAVVKLWVGFGAKSQALVADGVNSLSDVVVSTVVYLAFRISREPADKNHPYGHGNAETIAGLVVSVGVMVTGVAVGYNALTALFAGVTGSPDRLALYAAAFSIVIKEILFRYTFSVAGDEHSPSLKATAKDYRSDVLASAAAFFGIAGARLGFPYLDPLAGLIIAIIIFRMGISLLMENIHILMVGAPEAGLSDEILSTVRRFDDVKGTPRLRIQRLGGKYVVNLVIAVDGSITVAEGHSIAERVRDLCMAQNKHLSEVIIHIDPHKTQDSSTGT